MSRKGKKIKKKKEILFYFKLYSMNLTDAFHPHTAFATAIGLSYGDMDLIMTYNTTHCGCLASGILELA